MVAFVKLHACIHAGCLRKECTSTSTQEVPVKIRRTVLNKAEMYFELIKLYILFSAETAAADPPTEEKLSNRGEFINLNSSFIRALCFPFTECIIIMCYRESRSQHSRGGS